VSTFDFVRADDDAASFFYARGKNPGDYHYVKPTPEDDGWPTGTLAEVGISEAPLKKFIETVVDPPATSVHDFLYSRHTDCPPWQACLRGLFSRFSSGETARYSLCQQKSHRHAGWISHRPWRSVEHIYSGVQDDLR
jgi:hypothetical protein